MIIRAKKWFEQLCSLCVLCVEKKQRTDYRPFTSFYFFLLHFTTINEHVKNLRNNHQLVIFRLL